MLDDKRPQPRSGENGSQVKDQAGIPLECQEPQPRGFIRHLSETTSSQLDTHPTGGFSPSRGPLEALPDYSRKFYERASTIPGFDGQVLIIGGTPEEAQAVRALGAKYVVIVNPELSTPRLIERCRQVNDPRIELVSKLIEDAQLVPQSFDLILSECAIEHMLDLPRVLKHVADLLKRGGRGLMHGGPVWTADRGHHVWVKTADGTRYFFNEKGDAQPIQPWEHLLFADHELWTRLVERGIPKDHATAIVHHIYHSHKLNRLSPSTIEQMVLSSPLYCRYFTRHFGNIPDEHTANRIAETYTRTDLATWAIEFSFERSQ